MRGWLSTSKVVIRRNAASTCELESLLVSILLVVLEKVERKQGDVPHSYQSTDPN